MKKNILFKLGALFLGFLLFLAITEITLNLGSLFLRFFNKEASALEKGKELIIFSGDSWTQGADASEGRSFFDLIAKDNDFLDFNFVNLGWGSNNTFQVVNSILGHKKVPKAVVIGGGINSWHLIGQEKFLKYAKDYLSGSQYLQLSSEFKSENSWAWIKNLKIYKLYNYFFKKNKRYEIDIKALDEKIATAEFYKTLLDFRDRYSSDYERMHSDLPVFVERLDGFSLDEKFYFVALQEGFNTENMQSVLKKAGIFYPQELEIIPYAVYEELDITKKGLANKNESLIKWSFEVLASWAWANNVIVFVQTYPDIKMKNMADNSFERVNERIKFYGRLNNFKIIDQNSCGTDWTQYKTCWHVNDDGHLLMKDNIKKRLIEINSVEFPEENLK